MAFFVDKAYTALAMKIPHESVTVGLMRYFYDLCSKFSCHNQSHPIIIFPKVILRPKIEGTSIIVSKSLRGSTFHYHLSKRAVNIYRFCFEPEMWHGQGDIFPFSLFCPPHQFAKKQTKKHIGDMKTKEQKVLSTDDFSVNFTEKCFSPIYNFDAGMPQH